MILMPFAIQQTSRAAARASAERLVQLPPEAIAGLSADERAQILNFAVPADGTSAVPALPELDGTVAGTVFEGDAIATLSSGTVTFNSNSAIFGRTLTTGIGTDGTYQLSSSFSDIGNTVTISREPFTVRVVHPLTNLQSPLVTSDFAPGDPAVLQNIIFTNAGLITGTVRRPDGTVLSTGSVELAGGALVDDVSVPIAVDGIYFFGGGPPSTYTVMATLPNAQGSDLTGSTSSTVVAEQPTTSDITISSTGGLTGTV